MFDPAGSIDWKVLWSVHSVVRVLYQPNVITKKNKTIEFNIKKEYMAATGLNGAAGSPRLEQAD
jgi:hypothetical protein